MLRRYDCNFTKVENYKLTYEFQKFSRYKLPRDLLHSSWAEGLSRCSMCMWRNVFFACSKTQLTFSCVAMSHTDHLNQKNRLSSKLERKSSPLKTFRWLVRYCLADVWVENVELPLQRFRKFPGCRAETISLASTHFTKKNIWETKGVKYSEILG